MRNKLYFIPNIFTLLNLGFGYLAIIKIISGEYPLAAWFIIFAVIFDAWDGAVARLTNMESRFGFLFDTLADIISSGLAPSLLIYQAILYNYGMWGIMVSFIYVFSGCYRLSRFHVLKNQKKSTKYTGLPLPVSAVTISALWIFNPGYIEFEVFKWWIFIIIFLSFIMISPVPYSWPVISYTKGYKTGIFSTILLLGTIIMILFPKKYLFPFIMIYILYGIIKWIVKLVYPIK